MYMSTSRRAAAVFFCMFLAVLVSWVSAVPSGYGTYFPENYETRLKHKDLIFGTKTDVFSFEPAVYPQVGDGSNVSMQVMRQNESFYLLFTNQRGMDFPIYSRGSYIIRRNEGNGTFEQIKIFVRSEPGSFVRIFPDGNRSVMDVYLMEKPVFRDVILPMPLEQLVVEPFMHLVEASRYQVDWSLFTELPQRPGDLRVSSAVETLRSKLDDLRDSEDGALDADGTFRFIEDLNENPEYGFNCSGFAKWVVDGFYLPRVGELLSIEELKTKHLESRGNEWSQRYEDERDPYFGLDWSRNLATAMLYLDASGSRGTDTNPEAADVRQVPFFDYFEDVGYRMENLDIIMYLLARQEPGYFYIGSINREFGTDPVLKQHVHVVVLFPYFDEAGVFQVSVMERNVETGVESLMSRYSTDHVHLVRVAAGDGFAPPSVEF